MAAVNYLVMGYTPFPFCSYEALGLVLIIATIFLPLPNFVSPLYSSVTSSFSPSLLGCMGGSFGLFPSYYLT